MRRWITFAAASLTGGLPLAWVSSAPCDGDDTTIDTTTSLVAQSAPPLSADNAQEQALGLSFCSRSQLSMGLRPVMDYALGFLPGIVKAAAEAAAPRAPLELAYRASLLQPLLSYMPEAAAVRRGQALAASTLQALEVAALTGLADGANLPQTVTLAWALAWAGHEPGKPYLDLLQAAASGTLPAVSEQRLGPAHRAVLLWCAVMHGAAPAGVWESGLRAVAAAAPGGKGLDECALLYLMHAALLYSADSASPGRRTAAAAGSVGAVSPTSPAAASAASPACQPRATREEVLAAAAPLGRKALEKLASVYGEYVPLHPAIEGPYLALLYILEQLAVGGNGDDGWEPPGMPEQAAAVLANPKELARIKRDLLYHWRGDQLVDELQSVRNQVVYLLTRRMGLTVAQPEDVDVAVPSRWLAIYVRGGGSSSSGSGGGIARESRSAAGRPTDATSALQDLESGTADALEVLLRDRFAPQVRTPAAAAAAAASAAAAAGPGAVGTGGTDGMWAARVRQLRRLGWRVAVVDVDVWRGLRSDDERQGYLLRVVRGGRV